ncbi:MAG TPA: phenylacetate--CoA ligase [Candidatus Dormibacteraeota bacterium]|jgi:phenylacetate-CoA ligase|nr:phenylacetate--CoA ligase [Candidatus Dormibacteraeota bacterium]
MIAEEDAGRVAAWNRLLAYARERVRFHRDRLPERIASIEEIARIPFTTKEDFRLNYPFGLLAVPPEEVVRVHMSSGTTGRPVVAAYTRGDMEGWAERMAAVLRMGGVSAGDVVQNAYGYGLFTGGLGFHLGAERIGAMVVPTSSGATARQVTLLCDLGVTVLACTPSYALVLAEAVEREGRRGRLRLRCGFFGGEPWGEGMRRQIERGLGLEPFDSYGLTELGGPGVAVECERHLGLHVLTGDFHAEVIDPESGDAVPDGEEGELVLTGLRQEACPVIRYRTRDRTALLPEPCPCGSSLPRIRRPAGRTDDMLVIRGENVFPTQIEEELAHVPGLAPQYQLVIDRERARLDTIEVRVEAEPGADPGPLGPAAQARIRESTGLRVEVTVLAPGSLPRVEGKANRVVDRRELGG